VQTTPNNLIAPRGLQTPGQTPQPAQRPQVLRPPVRPIPISTTSKPTVQQISPAPSKLPAQLKNSITCADPGSYEAIGDADTTSKPEVEYSSQFFASDDDAFYAEVDLNAESYGNDTLYAG
jgi:hypothetical protein